MNAARWSLAARFAVRELRAGFSGFRIFIASLALGVGAIATVGSVTQAVVGGLASDAREILGADAELERIYQPMESAERGWLADRGVRVSESAEIRTMARPVDAGSGRPRLVSLKTVDDLYPFYGEAVLEPAGALDEALALRDGAWGVLLDTTLPELLGVSVGDEIRLGAQNYVVRGVLVQEPGRAASLIALAPRVMVAHASLPGANLVQPGSLVEYEYPLKLADGADVDAFRAAWSAAWGDAGYQYRDVSNASPQAERFVRQVALFLTLVGLTALLVGGLGVSRATRAFLSGRARSIATLKCVGAPSALIFRTYLLQVLALAAVATVLGLVIGAVTPIGLSSILGDALPIGLDARIHWAALGLAAVFGLLTAAAFALWPLARAREIPAARLFRDASGAHVDAKPKISDILTIAAVVGALCALAILTAVDAFIASVFIAGAAVAVLIFRGLALAATRGAKAMARSHRIVAGRPGLRQALANLHRPGAATPDVILSLGVGLTVLVCIAQIEANLRQQVAEGVPDQAPSFYFIDIQTDQRDAFREAVSAIPGAGEPDTTPMVRGRIVAVNGTPSAELVVDEEVSWALRGDRGLTYEYTLPENQSVVRGAWWAEDYDGPPIVSMTEEMAVGFGMEIGDTVTLNILGRNITAELAATRAVDWGGLQQNFTFVFAPGVLERAPHSHIATVKTTEEAEIAVFDVVAEQFPNVSVIPVREALSQLNSVTDKLAAAVRITASVTLAAGVLVLAGAIAAGHRRRVYEAVVMKVLGATRKDMLRGHLLEFGALGGIAAALAAAIGVAAAWGVAVYVMRLDFSFAPGPVIASAAIGAAATLIAGAVGSWRALGRKAAPLLRNE